MLFPCKQKRVDYTDSALARQLQWANGCHAVACSLPLAALSIVASPVRATGQPVPHS